MQTTELIEQLEQAVSVTPNQAYKLLQGLGLDTAPEAEQPADAYDRVVAVLKNPDQKNGKRKTGAIAKAEAAQQQGKGAMVGATESTTIANIRAAQTQGRQLAQSGDRAMVDSYLKHRAKGMQQFAASLTEMGQAILEIADEAELNYSDEDSDSDFLRAGSGAFSLR